MLETIMIIGADAEQLRMTEQALQQKLHYRTIAVHSEREATQWIILGKQPQPDLLLVDCDKSASGCITAIQSARRHKPQLPIIAFVPYGDSRLAAQAVQLGVSDFLTMPVDMERLGFSLKNAFKLQRMSSYIAWLERKASGHLDFSDIIGTNPAFASAVVLARQAAASKIPVWVEGEEGVGKELFARAIHGSSDRAGKPFVSVDCKMLPDNVAEAALFGQDNEAQPDKLYFAFGKIREADHGTLLLENIGALKPELHKRLLELIETGMVRPVGAASGFKVDVRIICANAPQPANTLGGEPVSQRLYQRLKGVTITLPPLRERREDIPLLAEHFLAIHAASENKYVRAFTPRALESLRNAAWPANIHQLAGVIWRAVMLCDGDMLDIGDLQAPQKSKADYSIQSLQNVMSAGPPILIDERGQVKTLKSVQEEAIRFALQHAGGCMTRAARSLGIGRSTLYRKVNELSLDKTG